ncbi:MAG: HesA/MoeB/ThiF family protein [Deltaproteobacteria bacterium]|nr:HesA/MoeB/ThiF family protein [Deltaproteobacteria bacterium]
MDPSVLEQGGVQRRLARTRALAEVGVAGLRTLLGSRALVVGCGGLGHPVAAYLAGAGVGHLTLMDDDDVEETNLNRQLLFHTQDAGRPKAAVLQERVRALQPHVAVAAMEMRLTERNARGIVGAHRVVVDCTDDPATKFILQDTALRCAVPLVHGGAVRWGGQVTVIPAGGRPCLRCLFDEPPPAERCQDAGVLGAACGAVGAVMAAEAVKVLLGVGQPLTARLLTLDLLAGTTRVQPLYARQGCPHCAAAATPARR